MIEECTMFGCKCDGCGDQWDNGDCISYYPDKELTEYWARDSDWYICEDGKTYCPDCWSYDDNDNLVFKTTSPNQLAYPPAPEVNASSDPRQPAANDIVKLLMAYILRVKHRPMHRICSFQKVSPDAEFCASLSQQSLQYITDEPAHVPAPGEKEQSPNPEILEMAQVQAFADAGQKAGAARENHIEGYVNASIAVFDKMMEHNVAVFHQLTAAHAERIDKLQAKIDTLQQSKQVLIDDLAAKNDQAGEYRKALQQAQTILQKFDPTYAELTIGEVLAKYPNP